MVALIADTDATRRTALEQEFRRHGHDVLAVDSSRAALAEVGEQAPTLVALAWRIGDDDGLELCRAIRGIPGGADSIVVLVGESPGDCDVGDAIAAGATDIWSLRPEHADQPREVAIRLSLAEHYARLQTEHVRIGGEFALLRRALDLTGTGFTLSDPELEDDPIVYANESFYELTGYSPGDVLGRNCRFLQGPDTDQGDLDILRRALEVDEPVTVELLNYRRDGSSFWNEIHVSPVRSESGKVVRRVGVQIDVSAYRQQERLYALEQEARANAQAAEQRSAFLANASPLLDASLDLRATIDSLARLSVPFLGDVCVVDVIAGDGQLRRVAVAASDPYIERMMRELTARDPEGPSEGDPMAEVMRTGRSTIIRRAKAAAAGAEENAHISGGGFPRSAAIVPLRTRGRTIGALEVATLANQREYTSDDVALVEDLARRAALALDNARLYEGQRNIARTLRESLLPERLPEIPGLEVAARFRPAGDGREVGGDFYDVFEAEGRWAIVIGDVSGKGAEAAALTGLARHTIRAAALYEREPHSVLAALNRAMLAHRSRRNFCTVAFCLVRPDREGAVAAVSCGGHPLPLLLREGGQIEWAGAPGTLLGLVADPELSDQEVRLRPGDALIFYTDGVTEARTERGMLGEKGLSDLVHSLAGLDAGGVARGIERRAVELQGGRPRDDIAITVVRVPVEAPASRTSRAAAVVPAS